MAQVIQIKRRIPGTGAPPSGTGAGQVTAGELAVSVSAVAATGVADLFVGDGSFVHPLVSASRQVELTGDQTINGDKTVGTTGKLIIPALARLEIEGGDDGDILSTDGAGGLSWIEPPKGVQTGTTAPTPAAQGDLWYNTTTNKLMVHNGTTWEVANHIVVAATAPTGAAAVSGNAWFNTTTNTLMVHNGTTWVSALPSAAAPPIDHWLTGETYAVGDFVLHGGHLWRATAANGPGAWDSDDWDQIATVGDLDGYLPLTGGTLSGNLAFSQANATITGANGLGLIATLGNISLTTPANSSITLTTSGTGNINLVTAANQHALLSHDPTVALGAATKNYVDTQVAGVSGAVRFVGNYDADASEVTAAASGTLTVGNNLPAAAAGNEGWFVIVTEAGTPTAPAPTEAMQAGDWIVSTGAGGGWVHVPLYHVSQTAAGIGVTTLNGQTTWTNVQLALQGIYTQIHTAGNAAVLADHTSVLGDGTSATATTTAGLLRVGTVDGGSY